MLNSFPSRPVNTLFSKLLTIILRQRAEQLTIVFLAVGFLAPRVDFLGSVDCMLLVELKLLPRADRFS